MSIHQFRFELLACAAKSALPWFQDMKAGTLLNIPDSEGCVAQSTKLEPIQGVEHQRNDILPGLWLCTNGLSGFPVPA